MAERAVKQQETRAEPVQAQAADLSARQTYQPVYVESRRSKYEGEARRAAANFDRAPIDFQPSPLGAAGQRTRLGPDLSRKLTRELDKGGEPLPSGTRARMERHFHRKLGGVRVVNNAVSDELTQAVETHAFTVGQMVFFGSGVFSPGDPGSERILAHEMTHALQQESGFSDDIVIQRDDPNQEKKGDVWEGEGANRGYILDFEQNKYTMPELKLPKINNKIKGKSPLEGITATLISGPFEYQTRDQPRDTAQRQLWIDHIQANNTQIAGFIDNLAANPGSDNDTHPFYYLKIRSSNQIVSGTKEQLLERQEFMIPSWNKSGAPSFYDVDHYREHQLRGEDAIENVWLLQNSANRSAGSKIRNTVLSEINELYRRARADKFFVGHNANRDTLRFPRTPLGQDLKFTCVRAGDNLGNDVDVWTADDIIAAKQFRFGDRVLVRALTIDELRELGLTAGPNGPPTTVLWFLGKDSSFYRRVDIADLASPKYNGSPIGSSNDDFIKNFKVDSVSITPGFDPETATEDQQMGSLTGHVRGGVGTYYSRDKGQKVTGDRIEVQAEITMPLLYDPRYGYGSYIDRTGVRQALMAARAAEAKGTSPLAITEAGLSDEWAMEFSATLTSTHPLFEGFEATLGLTSYGIQLDVAIPTERLDFGFFRVTEADLSVAYGDEGLLFGGSAAFELRQVGTGAIAAMGEVFEGEFNFDFDFVNPAMISVRYENESWAFGGELGITEGVIPGLNSGLITVGIDEEGEFTFTGTAEVQLPGQTNPVEIEVGYSEEEGLSIGGTVDFDTSAWPMVENATVTVDLGYDTETGVWSLGGTGTASFAFPGVTGTLSATYNDGGIIFSGNGDVAIGNATGEFSFAIGNYPVNDQGEFDTSVDPLEEFDAWGSGSVSIEFGSYLTGTAGIAYTPEDEIVISGGIALPPSIELFEAREYERELLPFPRVEFPIFGVTIPVVGSIGVFGFIGGALRGFATIGPATLDDTAVDVTYTLGEPESAEIHGESHLNFGVEAGLELDVSGGLGLGVAVADVTGEVGITAALVLNVDAGADLDVDWTPVAGLSIDMALRGSASPSFRVGVFGQVAASVAVYGEVWSERWDETLAEFGSGLEISIVQPATWDEENGLDLDFANAEFTYPDIDLEEISSEIMDRMVG
ncbi:protein of unknown function [Nitrosospira sp. Nl5]|uniref:eCIS core domain-containing protein n=1 Tax=Nitrosospira sp. Nl5 TaxID=200120 RepID=UPI0008834F19|nr:DUF4157 domain-containing protein [Nitrosospira sp. Nl5]SCY10305.1 protein of unknown function [Nitrosospira sp. Nl5]